MKPFYGIDRTADKKSTAHEGACFIAATVSDFTRQSYEQALNNAAEQVVRAQLFQPLRWIKTGCGWIAALIALGIARSLGDVTLFEAYDNAPALFWTFGICGAVWAVLAVLNLRKTRTVTEGEDFVRSARRLDSEIERVFQELEVPADAKEVDVVQLTYRWKNGKLKIHTQGMETTPYTNVSMRVFRRENVLCLADALYRYELPIAQLRCLKKVKKPLVINGWNKDEKINSEFYKPYRLTLDNYERVHTRCYGLLELTCEGADWAVWLPSYELNYISALTGLPITEE